MNKALKKCKVFHFADDTNLLYSNPDPKKIKKVMDKELKLLYDWLCANRLSLNVAKTEFIIFRPPRVNLEDRIVLKLNRTKIYESTKIKYLGLILDSRLSWKFHISELSKKLSRSVGMLYKIRDFTPKKVLVSLYHSIFKSNLRMASQPGVILKKQLTEKLLSCKESSSCDIFCPFQCTF